MKKRNLALLGLTVLAGLSLASCGGGTNGSSSNNAPGSNTSGTNQPTSPAGTNSTGSNQTTPGEDDYITGSGNVDVFINYSGQNGISVVQSAFYNQVEGKNYVMGELLPTWKSFSEKVGVTIREASEYKQTTDISSYQAVKLNNFKSETSANENIDLFYNTTKNIDEMGASGQAVDLMTLVNAGKMPNFAKWLKANPTMQKTIQQDGGKIYYTPYFDGYQDVERTFVMNTEIAEKVLDNENAVFDTAKTNGTGADENTNVLKAAKYQPYVDLNYNYPEDTTVSILVNGSVQQLVIKKTTNIIKQQNELLQQGATGAQLANQFISYLKTAFADGISKGYYTKLSEIFTSTAAAYNADELVALMRVIKANPKLISGDENEEIELIVPRGVANNRVENIADFMQIWGIQGMTSKAEMLYFDASGNLNDAATTQQTYDGLQNLAALYDEGLILGSFWSNGSQLGGTGYLNKYFGKTTDGGGYAFMLYDYAASTGAVNDKVDGIGTDPETRVDKSSVTGVRPVLPPLAYWATETSFDHTQSLSNKTGKTLLRYAEENRSLKGNAWCIPSTSDNIEGAAALMDFMFSTTGSRIQDFGPDDGKYWTLGEVGGETAPVISSTVKTWLGSVTKTDFWTFYRTYIGSTHGIGCVRSKAIQIQSCNAYAAVGLDNVEAAIANGVVNSNLVDKNVDLNPSGFTWDSTVPTTGYDAPGTAIANQYAAITEFWKAEKNNAEPYGWVAVVAGGYGVITPTSTKSLGSINGADYSLKDVYSQMSVRENEYLYKYSESINALPSYLQ